jgi:hypothetical protein
MEEQRGEIDYEYFFETLKNYPEESQMPNYEYEWWEES